MIVSIFSKGHRNPQGLENINNKIFSTEHGPKGGDELNIITKNSNYGGPYLLMVLSMKIFLRQLIS